MSAKRIITYHRMFQWRRDALIRLCAFAGRYECAHFGHARTSVLLARPVLFLNSLRKHAYSNILKFLPPKKENFQIKNSDIFHISAQNIDCGYSLDPLQRGGSNEYIQPMFLSINKKK